MKYKKITIGIASTLLACTLIGCSATKTEDKGTSTDTTKNTTNNKGDNQMSIKNINWTKLGQLPAPKGYNENIGTAGLVKGVINDKFIVGGGANFPDGSPLKGGKKVVQKDIYLFQDNGNGINVLDQYTFTHGLAYGANVVNENTLYYLGGEDTKDNSDDLLAITIKDNKINVEKIGELPVTVENAIAQYKDGKIYFGVGKLAGKLSKDFYVYDLKTKESKKLAEFPGEARNQSISQIFGDEIVVFSGGDKVTYQDGYKYNIKDDKWEKLADVKIGDEEISLLGADAVKLNDNELLTIGGFNKDVWKEANEKLGTLQGEEKEAYRKDYFSREISAYKWNKKMLVYNIKDNTWKSLGDINFDAPCGNALLMNKGNVYSIMGEIKPTVRTPNIYKGTIEK